MKLKVVLLLCVVVFAFQCSHYDELQKNGSESKAGDSSSHNFGQDCMSCHHENGSEAEREGGWWNIAGSVYDEENSRPFTNGVVELWSKPNREGVLYYSIPIDALGNFYTEKIVKYNGTAFPVVVNSDSGEYEAMEPAFHGGGCNSCHGNTRDLITFDE